jgi:hypothetical protein
MTPFQRSKQWSANSIEEALILALFTFDPS